MPTMSILNILLSMKSQPHNRDLDDELIGALHAIPNPSTLNISEHGFGMCTAYDITATDIRNLFRALEKTPKITTLNFSRVEIYDYDMEALAEALHTNKTIITLNLEDNHLGVRGASALAAALHYNKTLKNLILKSIYMNIGTAGVIALIEALNRNITLENLELGSGYIRDTEILILATFIRISQDKRVKPSPCLLLTISNTLLLSTTIETLKAVCLEYPQHIQVRIGSNVYPCSFPPPANDNADLSGLSGLLTAFQDSKNKQKAVTELEIKTPNIKDIEDIEKVKKSTSKCFPFCGN